MKLRKLDRFKRDALIVLLPFSVLLVFGFFLNKQMLDMYSEGIYLFECQNYSKALNIFSNLGEYKNSSEYLEISQKHLNYEQAKNMFENKEYLNAIKAFSELDNFMDSEEMVEKSKYYYALQLYNEGSYNDAYKLFIDLQDFGNSEEMAIRSKYDYVLQLYEDGNYNEIYATWSGELSGGTELTEESIYNYLLQLFETYTKLQDQIDDANKKINIFINDLSMSPTALFSDAVTRAFTGIDSELANREDKPFEPSSFVAYSSSIGKEYTVEQLAGTKLLLPYKDGKQEFFFYGEINEAGAWQGNCIVNVYEEGQLKLITDAVYDHGNLITFKQIFPYTTSAKFDVWAVSERTSEDSFNSGETWYHFRGGDFNQNFEFDKVTSGDIISIDEFKSTINTGIEGYYCGRTSNGYFNDDTGTAVLIKYFEDGTIRTLYMGKIKDGNLNDNTGNAWMIGKTNVGQSTYSYYRGNFKNGIATGNSIGHWKVNLSKEDINELIDGFSFNCDLNWGT